MVLLNTLEGGTDEVTVTTANSGGASGDAFTVAPAPGASAVNVYDAAFAAHGTMSMRNSTGATNTTAYAGWTLASVTEDYAGGYLRVGTLPVSVRTLARYMQGSSQALRLSVLDTGQLRFHNAAGSSVGTTTAAITAGQFWRFSMHPVFSTTVGAVELRLFTDPESGTPTETLTLTGLVLTSDATELRYGVGAAATNAVEVWYDNVSAAGTDWPAPIGDPPGGGSTIAFVSAGTFTSATSTTAIVVPRPVGVAAGDVMVAVLGHLDSTGTTTFSSTPAGWILLGEQRDGTGIRTAAYYRVATGSEAASWTWTIGSAFKAWGWAGAYSGVDTDDPIRVASSIDSSSGTAHDTPEVTAADGDWLISAVAARHAAVGSASTWTSSSGTDIERLDFGSNAGSGQDIAGAVYDTGATLTAGPHDRTLTSSQTESLAALWSIVLRASGADDIPTIDGGWGIPANIA